MSSKSSNKESSNVRHPRGSQLSEVWAYYNRIEDSFDVICKQEKCRKVIERKDNKHTFAMWTHLQQAHEDIYKTTKHSQQRGQQKKLELEKIQSPRKTRKRVAAPSPSPSNTAGSSKDALKSTAESYEPKKKQPKADGSSEPTMKQLKADGRTELTKKPAKSDGSSEQKKKQAQIDEETEPKTKQVKADGPSGKKNKQPKTDESAENEDEDEPKEKQDAASTYEDLLIAQVQRFPYLYDTTLEDYANKKKKSEAWTLVGKALNKKSQDVRGRWTQLRQNFSKKFKRTLADDDAVEQLKEHKLAFLIPFIKHSADGGVATNVDGHVLLEEIPKVTAEIPKFEEDEQDQEDADEVMDQDPNDSDDDSEDASEVGENEGPEDATNGAVKKQGQQIGAPPSSVGSPRKPCPSKLPEEEEEESDDDDEDELFFRTLRCKFRKMDEETKERTKMKLLGTIVDLNYGPK
ncbi:Transcription factor Adf-1 [Aphelenchoides avenae]|nr:Transcription factor Adf-1 [Aphelenchus avenae]